MPSGDVCLFKRLRLVIVFAVSSASTSRPGTKTLLASLLAKIGHCQYTKAYSSLLEIEMMLQI